MFIAVPMVRVRIQVPAADAAAATHAVAGAGLLHLIDVAHGRTDAAMQGNQELLAAHRALRDRLRRALDRLGHLAPPLAGGAVEPSIHDFEVERQRITAELESVEAEIDTAWTARDAGRQAAAGSEQALSRARALDAGGVDVVALRALRFASATVLPAAEEALASLSRFMDPAPHRIEIIDGGPEALAVVIVPASARPRLDAALRLAHVEGIAPADLAGAGHITALEGSIEAARREAADADAALSTLAAAHVARLSAMLARADTCTLLLQAQERFGTTGRFVVIAGWIPEADVTRLAGAVAAVVPRAVTDIERPAADVAAAPGVSGVPILHRNPVLLRPFQVLVEMYDTPSYGEVQPTAFFGISFLLMFGLMFGDVGHGAVLASAGYYLFRYMPRFLDYGILLMEAGAASACFGVLYGSLLGIEGALPVLWLEPVHDLPAFMRIAVAFGVTLVSVGLMLNVYNSWRLGQRAGALFSIRGLFGAFVYWTSIALVIRLLMPATMIPSWVLWGLAAGAGILILARAPLVRRLSRGAPARAERAAVPRWLSALEGSVELVDALVTYFANTVSFVRLAAFAAVHAGVFIAMFAVSDTLAATRFGTPLAIAALAAGNAVLILLEGLTVSVQVLRLEYYEFFGKFFRGGGELYRPLMLKTAPNKEGGAS